MYVNYIQVDFPCMHLMIIVFRFVVIVPVFELQPQTTLVIYFFSDAVKPRYETFLSLKLVGLNATK